ncbi:MAG TPA: lipid A 3-O-deacylase [Selenomonas sp.]|nr:lipid A 3-O-deacylase [Selenomonas sp.]
MNATGWEKVIFMRFLQRKNLLAGLATLALLSGSMTLPAEAAGEVAPSYEVQVEYLHGCTFKKRDIDLYNVHVFKPYRQVHALTMSYGLTLERALGKAWGYEGPQVRDSQAVGVGPAYMLRYTRAMNPRWDVSLEGTGSVLLYNQDHPGGGRRYGFLWRIGPRFTYHAGKRDSVSLGYLFHHSSNGMKHHNPGYNGAGVSLGYTHHY